eukprot:scaffold3410_cov158-Amphora_coffeaeformis.AAC.3
MVALALIRWTPFCSPSSGKHSFRIPHSSPAMTRMKSRERMAKKWGHNFLDGCGCGTTWDGEGQTDRSQIITT